MYFIDRPVFTVQALGRYCPQEAARQYTIKMYIVILNFLKIYSYFEYIHYNSQ